MREEQNKNDNYDLFESVAPTRQEPGCGALYTRSECGAFKEADEAQILEAARGLLSAHFARGKAMTSPELVKAFLQAQLAMRDQEVFAALWLDTRHRVIDFNELFYGTVDGAFVYPREVLRTAIKFNAAACILVHNHPSGVTDPSEADRKITARLIDALRLIDVRVLDHIIVGESCTSFAELGLL